jgi:hypothetical protein
MDWGRRYETSRRLAESRLKYLENLELRADLITDNRPVFHD